MSGLPATVRLTYRTASQKLDERLLYRDHEPRLELAKRSAAYDLTADAATFKIAAEALRIRMAGRFDPMLAVHTSDLEPLPHQIQAVYGELIQRTPLRFLLADDPGAGKTIMAGLYIKELMLRGDLERCLIVAPGGLVEQWQDEPREKFGLTFELLTRQLADAEPDGNVFARHNLLIARMDQLSRSDEFKEQLERADWDLVVVDEAHRMSAHYFGNELKKTKRYQLGELLGKTTRHFLLMTATPHAGREEDFQLFMALLDTDRFEGRYRDAVHTVNTDGLMRRMVKEDLKTFEGKPLFPERCAYTVAYELSKNEKILYDAVTEYVRDQMNLADRLRDAGDKKRGFTVGFALTVLQRRLASSPEAILKSLERRHKRLEKRRSEMRYGSSSATDDDRARRLRDLLGKDPTEADLTDAGALDGDDLPGEEAEEIESEVADAATAARTIAELDKELAILADLIELARRVRHSGTDKQWTELRELLTDNAMVTGEKIIIFTEHRDTLEYLTERPGTRQNVNPIRAMPGASPAALTMARASSRLSLSGFSQSTCFPAASRLSVICRCSLLATTMLTTSMSPSATIASQEVSWRSYPNRRAAASASGAFTSAIETSRTGGSRESCRVGGRMGLARHPGADSSRRRAPRRHCPGHVYRSRTSREVQARETQIIMQWPAFRSSSSRTESRWSGTPSSTGVSQVPQVPSAHDESTATPASSIALRIEDFGGTVTVISLRAR
jgi:superfamily II DNA or RNA helicase